MLHIDAVAVPGSFNKLMEFKKLDQEQRRKYEEEKKRAVLDEIKDAAGFKSVIDAMAESGKPILGHNMLIDCLHLFEQFRATLPETLLEFKEKFHATFPRYVLDLVCDNMGQNLTLTAESWTLRH